MLNSLQKKVDAKLEEIYTIIREMGVTIPKIDIRYDLHSVNNAGQANATHNYIRLHPTALIEYGDLYIERTVVHEAAHIIARAMYGDIQSHGPEWKYTMRAIKALDVSRCHAYDLRMCLRLHSEKIGRKVPSKSQSFAYKCGCKTHMLSATIHKKALSGTEYFCKKCKSDLIFVGE